MKVHCVFIAFQAEIALKWVSKVVTKTILFYNYGQNNVMRLFKVIQINVFHDSFFLLPPFQGIVNQLFGKELGKK